jgi:hypothetical protein
LHPLVCPNQRTNREKGAAVHGKRKENPQKEDEEIHRDKTTNQFPEWYAGQECYKEA